MVSFHITADRCFDGTGAAIISQPALRVAAGRIDAVKQGQVSQLPPADCRFDFPGCTILPGLIDTHVHLIFCAAQTNAAVVDQVGRESADQLRDRALANALAALRAGLTTLRDCGGKARITQEVRDRINRGEGNWLDGPGDAGPRQAG